MNPDQESSDKVYKPRPHSRSSSGIPELPDYVDELIDAPGDKRGWLAHPGKRKFLIWSLGILLLLACIPASYRGLKGWRAVMLLNNANTAFAVGENQQGISLLKQALALAPGNLTVQHSVELYNARSGDKTSLELLLSRMRFGGSGDEELLGIAELEVHSGEADRCHEALGHLSGNLTSAQRMRLTLIEAALLARQSSPLQAASLCLAKSSEMGKREATQLRIQAARYLFSLKDAAESRHASEILLALLRERSRESIVAWRILTHLSLSSDSSLQGSLTPQEAQEMLKIFPSLSGGTSPDRLLAAELAIHHDPSSREAVIKRLKEEYHNASRTELLDFARWLNGHGLPAEAVELAGADQARNDTEWLLVVLDAQSALGKWKEIDALLGYPAAAGVPDAVRHLFLARIALMTGNDPAAEEEWRNVGGALSLEKPETLAYVAGYEEQIGALDQAIVTYRELAARKESTLPGLIGQIRCHRRTTPAKTMIPLYEELLAASPDLPEAVGDLAYLKLLVNEDIAPSAATSEKLLAEQPGNLARISAAALGRLKQGNVPGAMALYGGKEIDWNAAPEPWRAVRVAVLRAAGEIAAAEAMAAAIDPSVLRPEEQNLLKKKEAHPSKQKRVSP